MNFEPTKPIFRQIADHICDEIMQARFSVGGRIPSVREYAVALEVNVNTVVRSFEILQNDGIIVKDRGVGFFVADEALDIIRKKRVERFNEEVLPNLYRQMQLLGISCDDIVSGYERFLNEQK